MEVPNFKLVIFLFHFLLKVSISGLSFNHSHTLFYTSNSCVLKPKKDYDIVIKLKFSINSTLSIICNLFLSILTMYW